MHIFKKPNKFGIAMNQVILEDVIARARRGLPPSALDKELGRGVLGAQVVKSAPGSRAQIRRTASYARASWHKAATQSQGASADYAVRLAKSAGILGSDGQLTAAYR